MELKKIIENPKNKFKIEKIIFKPKIKNLLGFSYRYFLKYNNKYIYLGLKRDIDKIFRKLLKDIYGDLWFKDYPNTFFKNYLHKEYNKITRATEKTRIKKKSYYSRLRIESKKNKIEKLKQEIIKEQENLKKMN